ncbi:MAG: hypothetical protein RLY84_995, partial [Actinomycetota bacterium]
TALHQFLFESMGDGGFDHYRDELSLFQNHRPNPSIT